MVSNAAGTGTASTEIAGTKYTPTFAAQGEYQREKVKMDKSRAMKKAFTEQTYEVDADAVPARQRDRDDNRARK